MFNCMISNGADLCFVFAIVVVVDVLYVLYVLFSTCTGESEITKTANDQLLNS